MHLRLHREGNPLSEIEALHRRIMSRAFELFEARPRVGISALDDWLRAERELVWAPPIELTEKDGVFTIEMAVAGVDPKQLEIQAMPDCVVVKAEIRHEHDAEKGVVHRCEFAPGRLFRSVRLPHECDLDKSRAEWRNGLLTLVLPMAAARRLTVTAA